MIVEIEADDGCELDEQAINEALVRLFMTASVGGIRKRNGDLPPSIPCQGKQIPVYAMDNIPEHLKRGPNLAESAKDHA